MTLEDDAFARLWRAYEQSPSVHIHSGHPPSGKSYRTPLVRFQRKENGAATRGRYHLDYVIQLGRLLVLQELKGRLSEAQADVLKLRQIMADYSLEEFKAVLRRRIDDPGLLQRVAGWIPTIGCAMVDTQVPPDFIVFEATMTGLRIHPGRDVRADDLDIIRGAFGDTTIIP